MKHAGTQTIETLGALIERLRDLPGVLERKPGIFYRKGKAFLHFHEDPAGVFADVQDGSGWVRMAMPDGTAHEAFLVEVRRILGR